MSHDPQMTGEDSTRHLMEQYRALLKEADQDRRVNLLTDFVFAYVPVAAKQFRELRAKLPVKPWIFNVASAVRAATIVGAVITGAVWLTRIECQAGEGAVAIAQVRLLDARLARMDGNLEILLRQYGIKPLPLPEDSH